MIDGQVAEYLRKLKPVVPFPLSPRTWLNTFATIVHQDPGSPPSAVFSKP